MKVLLALALVLAVANSYETEDTGVLVLHDSDFPNIITEFPHILIEFYAPWCGHCQRLAPAYGEAAKALASKNSSIKLAKVDATKEGESAKSYGVRGYPTIFFFIDGNKIDFKGERTKDGIINWLEKKILPATTQISSQEELDKLKEQDNVNLVLFTNDAEVIAKYKTIAADDDNSRYYIAAGDLLTKYPETTVEIHRNFGEVLTHPGLEGKFSWWLNKYSRPLVVDFDERTIGAIFRSSRSAIVLFNTDKSEELRNTLTSVAKDSEADYVFTQILPNNEHFKRFADYVKIKVDRPKVLAILSGERKKAIYSQSLDGLTAQSLAEFIASLENGSATTFGMEDEVKEPAPQEQAKAEEPAAAQTETAEATATEEQL